MLPKDGVSKLIGIFILLILLIITITLALAVFTIFQRELRISEGTWGFIGAILGGIIAGYITLKGVNKTIEVGNKDRFHESYNKQMKVIYSMLNKLEPISGFINEFLFDFPDITTLSVNERYQFLKEMADNYYEEFPNLLGVVDWHVIQEVDRLAKNLNYFYHLDMILKLKNVNLEKANKELYEARDNILGIYCCLNEHKQNLIEIYNNRIN
jgi:hypothetical protein